MTFIEIARRWTIVILAETLKISASAVESVLPFQPRWLAQIALLAEQLRAAADKDDDWDEEDDTPDVDELPDIEALLASHTRLRQGLTDIVARGLSLDEELLQRMRTDWTVESIVGFLSSAEKNLCEGANRALDEAAQLMGMSPLTKSAPADRGLAVVKPEQKDLKVVANPVATPARRSESVQ